MNRSVRGISWKKARALGNTKKGVMNKTEQAFAELLQGRLLAGEILGWMYEPLTFRLVDKGRRCSFSPDFMVQHLDATLEMVDVKAYRTEEDARVKIKVAADRYPMFLWTWERRVAGEWTRTEF